MTVDIRQLVANRNDAMPSANMIDMLESWYVSLKGREQSGEELSESAISAEDINALVVAAKQERNREAVADDTELDRQFTWRFMRERVLPLLCGTPGEVDLG